MSSVTEDIRKAKGGGAHLAAEVAWETVLHCIVVVAKRFLADVGSS